MEFSSEFKSRKQEISSLFTKAFTASEGAQEGALIGDLAFRLMNGAAEDGVFVFTAQETETVIAAAVFSRLTYSKDARNVFVLGPVAVSPERWKQGAGQSLLNFGLKALRGAGVDIVLTYGDPAYYSKTGFSSVTEAFAPAPFKLSRPEGWLGQALNGRTMTPLKGVCRCAEAFNNPAFW